MQNSRIEACARAAHEVCRAYCLAIGDNSQQAWEDSEEWQRQPCRAGVLAALSGATPQQSHEAWCASKIADGWTWGPVKDPSRKQHPCMMPYAELPPEQRAKDALYLVVVKAMADALDGTIIPPEPGGDGPTNDGTATPPNPG